MSIHLKLLPLLAILAATPAVAAEPDPHAGHHPAATAAATTPEAKPEVKPDVAKGCPMMDGKMNGGQTAAPAGTAGQGGPAMGMGAGGMAQGKTMMDGKDMHCMQDMHAAPAAAPDASAAKPAPK